MLENLNRKNSQGRVFGLLLGLVLQEQLLLKEAVNLFLFVEFFSELKLLILRHFSEEGEF